MEKDTAIKITELKESIVEQSRKTTEQIEELRAIATELRRQAEEIDQAIRTVSGLGSAARQSLGTNLSYEDKLTEILHKESRESMERIQRGPDHSYADCHDTAVAGCLWHSDAC